MSEANIDARIKWMLENGWDGLAEITELHTSKCHPYEHRDIVLFDKKGRPVRSIDGFREDPKAQGYVDTGGGVYHSPMGG